MLERLKLEIPEPPSLVLDSLHDVFAPSPELEAWLRSHFIEGIEAEGRLLNPHHAHLADAHLGVLWTNVENKRQGTRVVGTAEMPQKKGGWGGARSEFQLCQWFGVVPTFVLTFDAYYWRDCVALGKPFRVLALSDHELYHCGQKLDEDGNPKLNADDEPMFCMKAHDVEEFVGVVSRWGVGSAAGATAQLVQAALRTPQFDAGDFECLCGTCGKLAA